LSKENTAALLSLDKLYSQLDAHLSLAIATETFELNLEPQLAEDGGVKIKDGRSLLL